VIDEEIKERIELYQKTKRELEIELEQETDEIERMAIEYRIDSCKTLIKQLYERDNPTKDKGMYN